jgi:hypothetical protein
MVSPVFVGNGNTAQTASGTSLSPTKPTVRSARGILIAFCASKNNATHSTATSGWTKLFQTNSGASFTASVFIAAESAAAPVITWTGAAAGFASVLYYGSAQGDMEVAVGASSVGTGTTSPHASASITTTRDEALALYVDLTATNGALSTPAGWTEQNDLALTTAGGRLAYGDKPMPSTGGATGGISVTGGAAAYVQYQLEIYTTQPSNQVQYSKAAALAVYDALPGFNASKATVMAVYDALPGFDASKLSVLAWLDVGTYPPAPTGRRRQITNIN